MNPNKLSHAAYGLSPAAIQRVEDYFLSLPNVPPDLAVLLVLTCAAAEAQARGPILSPN